MSITKSAGRIMILGLVGYLFAKGALVLRPRETTAALSALIAALVHACCGTGTPSPDSRGILEEHRQGNLVGEGESHQRSEADALRCGARGLDDAQVFRMNTRTFGSLFLGQPLVLPDLPKTQAQTLSSPFDSALDGGTRPDLRGPMGAIWR